LWSQPYCCQFGHKDADSRYVTELGYQWQVKYRLQPAFEFGAQGFGEVGECNHRDNSNAQNHRFGPAIFGKLPVGDKQAFKYNAARLVGLNDAAPDNSLRLQVEFEF